MVEVVVTDNGDNGSKIISMGRIDKEEIKMSFIIAGTYVVYLIVFSFGLHHVIVEEGHGLKKVANGDFVEVLILVRTDFIHHAVPEVLVIAGDKDGIETVLDDFRLVRIIIVPYEGPVPVHGLYVTGFRHGVEGHGVVDVRDGVVSDVPKNFEVSISVAQGHIVIPIFI